MNVDLDSGRAKRKLLALAAVAMLSLAACGGSGGGDGGGGDSGGDSGGDAPPVELSAKEMEFSSTDITVESSPFTLALENTGTIEHDFSVEGTDIAIMAAATETVSDEVDLEPGTYTFFCSVPGHRKGGMEGTLTVEG